MAVVREYAEGYGVELRKNPGTNRIVIRAYNVTRYPMLAWLRRLIVSVGIGGVSYALMPGIMVLSVVYDQEFEQIITFAFDAGRSITNFDRRFAGA